MAEHSLIFLIGYRGSGKTTVARLLADRLGWSWRDADTVLEERFGRTIRQIFAEEGEAGFRDKESEVLGDLCREKNLVIATGGGVILRPENRARLRSGFVIWLTADAETLHRRIQADRGTNERRPALAQGGLEEVRQILAKREPIYAECAHVSLDTASRSEKEIADALLLHLPPTPQAPG